MNKVLIKAIYQEKDKYLGQEIGISGWVRTVRSSGEIGFIALHDGTCFKDLQVVVDKNIENFEQLIKLNIGSAITAKGLLIKSQGAGQAFELRAKAVIVVSEADPDYPLQKKRHSFEFLRTIAHLRPRSNTFMAVFRVASVLDYILHSFFQERGFVYVHAPIITTSDCEGAGEMFTVTAMDLAKPAKGREGKIDYSQDFFGAKTGLTVSGQLNAEAMCHAFRNVYTFGPTFRAENSNTARHAAEFWMLEPEMAFADINDNMDLAEDMTKYIIKELLARCPAEMEFFNKFIDKELLARLDNIANSAFERITYTKAIELLEKAKIKFEYPVKWGIDLQSEHERYLTEKIYQKPVFVIDYPQAIKAFYMRLNEDNPSAGSSRHNSGQAEQGKTVAAMDLLVPGIGEIIGGSQREERLDVLERRMDGAGLDKKNYWWYLEIRKYGGVIHSGYGLGFERLLMYVTGMANIRDVIPFPRTPKNASF